MKTLKNINFETPSEEDIGFILWKLESIEKFYPMYNTMMKNTMMKKE
jgi:hypothetical protein